MSNLRYSPATPEDIDVIYNLCRELIETYEDLSSIDLPAVLAWVRKKIQTQISAYTSVWQEGDKVAYFCLSDEPEGAELDDFYVLSEYRNCGIGSEVLEHCLKHAQKQVYLYVFTQNIGAIRLYERFGFITTKQVSPTRIIMTKLP